MSRTLTFNFDTGVFFAARTTSGGIRVGMNGVCSIEFPCGHEMFAEAAALTPDTVEAFIDVQIETGRIPIAAIA